MVRRDFEQRYVGSAAGWLWGVIHPLVLLVTGGLLVAALLTRASLDVTLLRGDGQLSN